MVNIWSSLSLIQVAKPQGPNTSSTKKIPRGEIGSYGLTSGTNTWQLGTSFISLLENDWLQPTEYGNGTIVLQMMTSIESRKGKYNITFLHQIADKQGWQRTIHLYGRKIFLLTLRQGCLHPLSVFPITTLISSTMEIHWLREQVYQQTFGNFLETWGGMWMWEGINKTQPTKCDLTWLVEDMKSSTLVWVTDGLYDQKKAADLSRVGWIIFCSKTGLWLTGTFWERSPAASSYWAEMLGLCTLHLFARALSEFPKIQEWRATLCCDNKRAVKLSLYTCCRIKPSAKCADIQQSLKATKCTFTGKFTYLHVYGHMDKYLLWHQSSLPQQLNCICDMLAKHAVTLAMTEGSYNRPIQLLPK
jgi:hypothetical protein